MKDLYLSYILLILMQLSKPYLLLKTEVYDLIIWFSIILGLYEIGMIKYKETFESDTVNQEPPTTKLEGPFSKEIEF